MMLPRTPELIILAPCTAHTVMDIIFLSGAFGLDSVAGTHALILFALFPGDYDGLLTRPFPKMIQLSVRYQLDPHNKWIVTLEPSKNLSFRRPVRDPCPALTNFKFCPHSKIFSRTGNFLLNNTLYLEVKLTDLPDPEGATPSTSQPWSFLKNPPIIFLSL